MRFYEQLQKHEIYQNWPSLAEDPGMDRIKELAADINQKRHVFLEDSIRLRDWQTLMSMVNTKNKVFLICENIPEQWPRPNNIEVINIHYWAWKTSKWMRDKMRDRSFTKMFKRNSETIQNDFFFTLGNDKDRDRLLMVKYLSDTGLLHGARFSSPNIGKIDLPQDPELYDPALAEPVTATRLETEILPYSRIRDDESNTDTIVSASRSSGFHLVLDNEFSQERCGNVNEKPLWPSLAQTPAYWITSDHVWDQLRRWGFVCLNQEPAPKGLWTRVKHHARNIWHLKQIQRSKPWQQKWQDLQGGLVENNRQALLSLHDRICEDVEQQLISKEFSW